MTARCIPPLPSPDLHLARPADTAIDSCARGADGHGVSWPRPFNSLSRSSKRMFAGNGESGPPCGVPNSFTLRGSATRTPARRHLPGGSSSRSSPTFWHRRAVSASCPTSWKNFALRLVPASAPRGRSALDRQYRRERWPGRGEYWWWLDAPRRHGVCLAFWGRPLPPRREP